MSWVSKANLEYYTSKIKELFKHRDVHQAVGTSGQTGSIKLCTFTVTGTYINQPLEIKFAQRKASGLAKAVIRFANVGTMDPTVDLYYEINDDPPRTRLFKKAESTWELWVMKNDNTDRIDVVDVCFPKFIRNRLKLTWNDEQVTDLSSLAYYSSMLTPARVDATPGDRIITTASFSSLPYTHTDSKIRANHKCHNAVLSNPAAQIGEWTVNTSNNSLTISGSISGTTSVVLFLNTENTIGT